MAKPALTANRPAALLRLWRPAQWIKNGFVLAPLLFAGRYDELAAVLAALAALACFCAVSSAVYIFNDLCDRDEDRHHPAKQRRPLVSGAVTPGAAVTMMLVLAAAGVIGAALIDNRLLLVIILYAAIHVAYSLGLKRLVILDVMAIAAGFVLRILGGSVVIAVPPSYWIILCTLFIAFFLGFTKRRAELIADHAGHLTRAVLKDYSPEFLNQLIAMVTGVTIVCYALYTVDDRTVGVFGSHAMLLTVPSVMYGLFRYLYLIYHLNRGEDPTAVVLRDAPTIINVLIYIALVAAVVQYGGGWRFFGDGG